MLVTRVPADASACKAALTLVFGTSYLTKTHFHYNGVGYNRLSGREFRLES